jgi:hypothetical protein
MVRVKEMPKSAGLRTRAGAAQLYGPGKDILVPRELADALGLEITEEHDDLTEADARRELEERAVAQNEDARRSTGQQQEQGTQTGGGQTPPAPAPRPPAAKTATKTATKTANKQSDADQPPKQPWESQDDTEQKQA